MGKEVGVSVLLRPWGSGSAIALVGMMGLMGLLGLRAWLPGALKEGLRILASVTFRALPFLVWHSADRYSVYMY